MSNIIDLTSKLKSPIEFDSCSYTINSEAEFGVRTMDDKLHLSQCEGQYFVDCKNKLISRMELAEFLWVAAMLLDSQERYRPSVEDGIVGLDYNI